MPKQVPAPGNTGPASHNSNSSWAHLVMQAMLPMTMPKQWYSGTGMHTLRVKGG